MIDQAHSIRSRRRAVILLDQSMQSRFADPIAERIARQPEGQRDVLMIVDCRNWNTEIPRIRETLDANEIDFVLFSRNDQILDRTHIGPVIRELRVGYSTFSAIDDDELWEQTETCLNDWFNRDTKPVESGAVALPASQENSARTNSRRDDNTFSLIFDLEQLAGARFGLPRILDLLDEFGARATFFTTSVIEDVYPGTVADLTRRGHEVGLHGRYHEYLSDKPLPLQSAMIRTMKDDFETAGAIESGNFVFRMDDLTVSAMVENGLKYFVVFLEHRYAPFSFTQPPLEPMLVQTKDGTIQLMPVSVETNNRPWFAVKNMIDSAIATGRKQAFRHFSILCHPFRDGTLRHIGDLRKILEYLSGIHRLSCVPVADAVTTDARPEPTCHVLYSFDERSSHSPSPSCSQRWWHHRRRYEMRVGNLMKALMEMGERPALCFQPIPGKTCFAVYPHLPANLDFSKRLTVDPLVHPSRFSRTLKNQLQTASESGKNRESEVIALVPRNHVYDLKNALVSSLPRRTRDYTALLPELALRVAYRLNPTRKMF